ncbi:MAG: 3-dehydroquinate synthase, partial [Gammaproteobacteria bacterium]
HSCENKAQIVAEDELEQSGKRALLNYGHTFGHAIETSTGYGSWLHGEAVACGMLLAADLSMRLGWLSKNDYARIEKLIKATNLPVHVPDSMNSEEFIRLMSVDKKVHEGKLYLVLLKKIGEAILTADFQTSTLNEVLRVNCNK